MRALGNDDTPQLTRKLTVTDTCYTIRIILLAKRNRLISPEVFSPLVRRSPDKIHTWRCISPKTADGENINDGDKLLELHSNQDSYQE